MTKMTNNYFGREQTRFSGGDEGEEIHGSTVVNRSTRPHLAQNEDLLRAKYIGPTSEMTASLVVSVDLGQVNQMAAIREINEKIKGRCMPVNTTYHFVL